MLIVVVNSMVVNSMAQVPAQPQRLGTEFGVSAFERECPIDAATAEAPESYNCAKLPIELPTPRS